jgi:hypothetical protein
MTAYRATSRETCGVSNDRLSPSDRRAFERHVRALSDAGNDDESTAWEASVVEAENRRRALNDEPLLEEWWTTKTEPELHERARALGLLDPLR